MSVQEIRWEKEGTVRAEDCNFSTDKETKIINREQEFLYTTELYQQLREWSLLVIECHI